VNRSLLVIAMLALVATGCGDDGPEATPEQAEAIGTMIDAELTTAEQRCILEELIATEIDPQTILEGTITGDEDAELLAIAVSCVDDLATVPAFVQSVIDASAESGTPFTEAEAICVIGKMADADPVTAAADCIGGADRSDDAPVDDYGDDTTLDLLWDACDDGNNQVCDELYLTAPLDSGYLEFARTCGGRLPDSVGLRCFLDLG
jgi:predicted small lipoprotein YifL